jgi:MscS family membrane protein
MRSPWPFEPRTILLRIAAVFVAACVSGPVSSASTAEESAPAGPADEFDRGTPRSAMEGFLVAARAGEWERAAEYLDLRATPRAERAEQGPLLAKQLKIALDRSLWVDLESLSDDPAGAREDGLGWNRDLVGRVAALEPAVPVYLDRLPRDDGVRIWKISSATVGEVPRLWDALGDGALAEWLPEPLVTWSFLEVRLWQWIGLALLGLAGAVTVATLARLFRPLVRRMPSLGAAAAPSAALAALALVSAGRTFLGLSVPASRAVGVGLRAAVLLALTWLAFRLVDAGERRVAERWRLRGQSANAAVLVLGRRAVKASLAFVAVLAILQNAGFDVTGLVAGLGVGGLAVALAAQRSLENLFGGLTIVADQPVRVGDFCRFGDRVGTVEDIGLRSIRVRTLERTVVTLPNAEFSSMAIENFAKRDRFWYRPKLGLRYETSPDQIRFLLRGVREMLLADERVDPDPARIRFLGFGESSLDLEVFAYVRTRDFDAFLVVAEELNLRIMDLVREAGTGFAFPSRTLYLRRDEAGDGAGDAEFAAAGAPQ